MADLLVKDGLVFTFIFEGYHALKLRRADVLIEDGRVAKIGPGLSASRETLDAAGCLVLPGFVNMGSRAVESRLLAGLLPDKNLAKFGGTYLHERILPVTELAKGMLTGSQIEAIATLSLFEGLRGGTTTAVDLCDAAFEGAVKAAGEKLGIGLITGQSSPEPGKAVSAVGSVQEGKAFPGVELLRSGVNVALATGYYGNDMLAEMRAAAFSAKQAEGNPGQYKATDAFYAATCAGARALGREEELGRIDVGMSGDLNLVDMERLEPLSYPFIQYLYSASPSDTRHVVRRGEILLRDGAADAPRREILAEARRTANPAILAVWEEARRVIL